jgi:hypothetical protein
VAGVKPMSGMMLARVAVQVAVASPPSCSGTQGDVTLGHYTSLGQLLASGRAAVHSKACIEISIMADMRSAGAIIIQSNLAGEGHCCCGTPACQCLHAVLLVQVFNKCSSVTSDSSVLASNCMSASKHDLFAETMFQILPSAVSTNRRLTCK